jgi:hypothetical protein
LTYTAEEPTGDVAVDSWWKTHITWSVLIPPLLFAIFLPETYGLTPNGLDPFFYTGYAINFDDIMREIGDHHYFVSRWSAYLPSRLFASILGPSLGRLALRWLIASAILLAVWHLGRRWSWNRATELIVGVVTLTSPMFARAYMTDYVEWFVVGVGIILVCQSLEVTKSWTRSTAIGAMAALVVIAYPLAATLTVAPILVYIGLRGGHPHKRWKHAVVIAIAGLGTIAVGLLAYRIWFDIPNVYAPTTAFAQDYANIRSPWKSPRLTWMGSFTWIYGPAILVAASLLFPGIRRRLFQSKWALAAVGLLVAQYAFQWIDQFVRDGLGLELSYNWVFVYPALAIAVAWVIGTAQWNWIGAGAFLVGWLLLHLQGRFTHVRLPAGWVFAALVVLTIGCLVAISIKQRTLATAGVIAFVLIGQVSAPPYDPSAYHPINGSPRYDLVFFNPAGPAERDLSEAIWLEDSLDELADDSGLFFFGGGSAASIIGIYGPHVTGRLLRADADGGPDEVSETAIRNGRVDSLVVYGEDDFVEQNLEELDESGRVAQVKMDRTHDGGWGYRLLVLDLAAPAADGFEWPASVLFSMTGATEGDRRQAIPGQDLPGFLAFGPYVDLDSRRYRVTVEYTSEADPSQDIGYFDVARDTTPLVATPLMGSDGAVATKTLDFEASGGGVWEFRVYWNGLGEMTLRSIQSMPL